VNICRNESAELVGMEINEFKKCLQTLERVKGIEPSYSAWKPDGPRRALVEQGSPSLVSYLQSRCRF
jgi:hypothetical protein